MNQAKQIFLRELQLAALREEHPEAQIVAIGDKILVGVLSPKPPGSGESGESPFPKVPDPRLKRKRPRRKRAAEGDGAIRI